MLQCTSMPDPVQRHQGSWCIIKRW